MSSLQRDYFILPPSYRAVVFAFSASLMAFVVWDKMHPAEPVTPKTGWDGDKVAVRTAAEAPSSIDVSDRLASPDQNPAPETAAKPDFPSTLGKRIGAPGKPIEVAEETVPATAFTARNEEERSAINERLYKNLAEEKKRMGIAKIIEKGAEEYGAGPQTVAKAIVLKNAEALQTAWTAAGLPGEPPAVKFPEQMAVFLACPPGCGIVKVRSRKKVIVVLYKNEGFDDASARVKTIALSEKPVFAKLME